MMPQYILCESALKKCFSAKAVWNAIKIAFSRTYARLHKITYADVDCHVDGYTTW